MVKTLGGKTNGRERKQLCTPVVMSIAKTALSLPSTPAVSSKSKRSSLAPNINTVQLKKVNSLCAWLSKHQEKNDEHLIPANMSRPKRGKTLNWSHANMLAAINSVQSKIMSARIASKQFQVPLTTLRDRLSGRIAINARPGRKPLLDFQMEEKLIDYASNRAKLGIGFGKRQFMKYAANLAAKYKKQFGGKKQLPSSRWWKLMNKRHKGKLSLRQPESTAAVRHHCIDAVKVGKYFAALAPILDEVGDEPGKICNMDETGLQLNVKQRKVVTPRGKKYLHSRSSSNRETIAVIACVNAAGRSIPPRVIVKGNTVRSLMGFKTDAARAGTNWSVSESGWTKQGLLETFLPHVGAKRPQILVLDGQYSHNFLELVDIAITNRIHMVEMPAHTSNWLQPCDRTIF